MKNDLPQQNPFPADAQQEITKDPDYFLDILNFFSSKPPISPSASVSSESLPNPSQLNASGASDSSNNLSLPKVPESLTGPANQSTTSDPNRVNLPTVTIVVESDRSTSDLTDSSLTRSNPPRVSVSSDTLSDASKLDSSGTSDSSNNLSSPQEPEPLYSPSNQSTTSQRPSIVDLSPVTTVVEFDLPTTADSECSAETVKGFQTQISSQEEYALNLLTSLEIEETPKTIIKSILQMAFNFSKTLVEKVEESLRLRDREISDLKNKNEQLEEQSSQFTSETNSVPESDPNNTLEPTPAQTVKSPKRPPFSSGSPFAVPSITIEVPPRQHLEKDTSQDDDALSCSP